MNKPFAVVIGCKVVARFNHWDEAARCADQTNDSRPLDANGRLGTIADVINLEFDADNIADWMVVDV